MNESALATIVASIDAENQTNGMNIIQSYIPPYVSPDSWQQWDSSDICPAGSTCTSMGNSSFGAFSCDELARIAVDEFGFGNVLAGTWCPEGEMGLLNCPVGGYCPNSATRIDCPAGMFCPHKTFEPTFDGGGKTCARCPAGAEEKRLSKGELIAQTVILVVLCLLVMIKIVRRKAGIDKEQLKKALNLDKVWKDKTEEQVQAVKIEQEKYARLRPKLEVIADRLGKINNDPQDQKSLSTGSPLSKRSSILYISKSGDIIFETDEFFDAIDKNKDGVLSFAEINEVLCLSDDLLIAFIANMRAQMSAGYVPAHHDKVARATFVSFFLDALADASQLLPTSEEAEELSNRIMEEVGTTDDGEILYEHLYSSSLSSFLRDLQIYGIISKFKQQEGKQKGISQYDFVKFYPLFLSEVSRPSFMSVRASELESGGLDVAFEHLHLTVTLGKKQVNVVDDVTGRLRSDTMTAVMGGSGSGKSSLLNALCGRAFYGKVTGSVKINGNDSKIEEHKAVIGFVPQEDIVYPDLTVRENLLYSGRLQLPAGTTDEEIAELADATMASLGLSRIVNSLVGDARRRGISGGEKKRVNIGLELMKKPNVLFLDEPTSGLDSRSAFVVMESLKRLVSTQGMTVACVIHQPRTDIYDMFDSLFLLGVGGRTVYHGPATECRAYFENLGFQMQQGESQADWFLDISSGEVESSDIEAGGTNGGIMNTSPSNKSIFGNSFEVALQTADEHDIGFVLEQADGVERGNFAVKEVSKIRYATTSAENDIRVGDKVVGINGHGVGQMTLEDAKALISKHSEDLTTEESIVFVQLMRQGEEEQSNDSAEDDGEESFLLNPDKPSNEDGALSKARVAREKLYRQWSVHFENLSPSQKARYYNSPKPFSLPITPKAVPGWRQLLVQLRRNCLLSWRNRNARLLDCVILLIAIFAMTLLGGVKSSSFKRNPGSNFLWIKFISSKEDASQMLPLAFMYALQGVSIIQSYAMMVGLIVSVLIGLNATKIITEKKLEFFRESQSGVSVTAFYIAASITSTFEQGVTAIAGSVLAYLVLKPSTSFLVYLWNFFMLSWLSVSWALLLSIVVPLESVSTVVGFWNAFFGLLFCGKVPPGVYTALYDNPAMSVFAGFVSTLRFFVEGIAVSEAKCLPSQSGYTSTSVAFNYPEFYQSYPYWNHLTFMAHTDLDTAIVPSCNGWFWWVPAAFAVGITIHIVGGVAIHFSDRSKQGKKSFRDEVVDDFHKCRAGMKPIIQSFILNGILVFIVFAGFLALSCWLILRKNPGNFMFIDV